MARACKHNNDCPQGKTCLIVAGANSGYCEEKGSTTVGSDKPIAGGGAGIQCASDAQCPQGLTCQNGACNQRTVITGGGGQTGGGNDVGGPAGVGAPPAPAESCEMVCMPPPDPYAAAAGSQPYSTEGYLSSYSTPNVQEGVGPGGHDPRDQQYLQNYVGQEQAYEQDWQNYANYMNQGGTTPAAVTVASQAATTPGYTTQQGDNTTPFTQYLANPYGY